MNLEKLFGEAAIESLVHCGAKSTKVEELSLHKDSGLYWIEDTIKHATTGLSLGLKPIVMEHGYNMNEKLSNEYLIVSSWQQIYEHITGLKE
jgi:hypothetical protein